MAGAEGLQQFGLAVDNWRQLNQLFARTDRETRAEIRGLERKIAEPVKAGAESLALTRISHIDRRWWRMRIGVTQKFLYVAPQQRGSRGRTSRSRPRFAATLAEKAMQPTAERYAPTWEAAVNEFFNEVSRRWNGIHGAA